MSGGPAPRQTATDPVADVLFLTYGMSVGGAETLMVSVVNALDRTRFRPAVATLAGPAELESRLKPDIELLRVARHSRFDPRPAREITALLKTRHIGAVLALGMFSYTFLLPALRALPGLRVLISLHTTRAWSVQGYLRSLLQARLLRRSDVLVTVCKTQAEHLARAYRIPRAQFTTVYNGVDTGRWTLAPGEFARAAFRQRLQIDETSPVILQVAQFRTEKNQEGSVHALAHLKALEGPVPYLVFVGGGDPALQEKVKALAARLGVLDRVRFCGQQSDVLPYYWASDLFTLSSKSETFPMAILEAMAAGLPCVMTDVGGAREVIEDGINGFVARPGDPAALALAWKSALDRRGSWNPPAIRERVQSRFSFEGCVRGYECLLLGKNNP